MLQGKKTLLVEDNPLHASTSGKVLEKLGMAHQLAQNGEDAIEMLGKGSYEVIFMDIDLPGISGTEVSTWINQNLKPAPLLIVLSTYSQKELALHGGHVHFDGYLNKPLNENELLLILHPLMVPLSHL